MLLVVVGGDGGVELVDYAVAEGAVEMEVEFDFGKVGDVGGLGVGPDADEAE